MDNSAGVAKTLSNDITNLTISTPRGEQDVTGLDKSAHERILLLADANETLNGAFNDAADMSHETLKTIPSTSVGRTVTNGISGQTLALELMFNDFSYARAADGGLAWTAPGSIFDGATVAWS